MHKINLYEAKTQLSKLVTEVAETGAEYIIARNGKPMAKIVPLSALEKTARIGFMKGKGKINVPDNFNDLHSDEIEDLFNGKG